MLIKVNMQEFGKYMNSRPKPNEPNLKVHYLSDISFLRNQNIYTFSELILSNSTLQILVGLYASDNCNSLQMKYVFPDGYKATNLITQSFVRSLPSIFSNVQVMYNGVTKDIYAVRYKDMNDEAITSYFELLKNKKIDPFLSKLLKKPSPHQRSSEIETYYEFLNSNKLNFKAINNMYKNPLLMFLISQCLNTNINRVIIPFRGWNKEEIENSGEIRELITFFDRVVFMGYGEPWMSTGIMFLDPKESVLEYFNKDFFRRGSK